MRRSSCASSSARGPGRTSTWPERASSPGRGRTTWPQGRHRLRRAADRRAGDPARGVNFDLGEEHELVRRTVRDFAEQRIAPVAEELDREERFPYDIVAELAELGLMGMPIPEEY